MINFDFDFLQKFREYCLTSNLIERLEARHCAIENALGLPKSANGFHADGRKLAGASSSGDESLSDAPNRPPSVPPKPKKKRIGHSVVPRENSRKRPRLFGGSLEEYVEGTGEEIPTIIRSCIRMLGIYGNF